MVNLDQLFGMLSGLFKLVLALGLALLVILAIIAIGRIAARGWKAFKRCGDNVIKVVAILIGSVIEISIWRYIFRERGHKRRR